MSQPWIAYGQTLCPFNTGVDNPPTNQNGILGEVASLPYTVPEGKVLVLKAWGLEAYADEGGLSLPDKGLVLVPWIGDLPATNAKCLHSVYSSSEFNETTGAEYHIPAGKKLNMRIMCAENPAQVVGWYLSGALVESTV